jgi:AcrR family transcriptional regulator
MTRLTETLARRAVERSYADRETAYALEMQRIVEATYELIEQSGSVEPSLRDILGHAGISTQGFYRYFRSKDELMLVLLDDGRRRLVEYLAHRMDQADGPAGAVRAWIEGVLAQAANPRAASRTRPFAAGQDRLSELFPEEQRESIDLLVDQLTDALKALRPGASPVDVRSDAGAIYRLVLATLHDHLILRTRPSPAEVEHTVQFCLRSAGPVDDAGRTGRTGRTRRTGEER